MDPSQNSLVPAALVLVTGALVLADCLIARQCARSGVRGADTLRTPALRAALRAGQAAGFFGAFVAFGLSGGAAAVAAAAAYLVSALLLCDLLVPRAARLSDRPSLHEAAADSPASDEQPAGLSVVASRAERLRDIPVSRLMVQRKSIVACDSSSTVEEAASILQDTGLSRVIVYARTIDRPLGLAHIKDVLPLLYGGRGGEKVESFLRPLVLISSSARALDLLRDFQRLKRRVAIVRDLQGERTLGLVSTEDILEEMVGEIQDEREDLSSALESGVALVRGDLRVLDMTRQLGMRPYRARADMRMGELVESLLGGRVRKGDAVLFRGLRITVEEMVDGDIWMVRIERAGD